MRVSVLFVGAAIAAGVTVVSAAGPRLNPMVSLLEAKQAVFGLYAPSARAGRGAAQPSTPRTPADLAKETLAHPESDFIFDGNMEGGVDRGLPAYADFLTALLDHGLRVNTPKPHLTQSLVVKMQEIGTDYAKATEAIGKQLNAGVTTIMFVGVESAAEVRAGLKAMRFTGDGGTRDPKVLGNAPKVWGLSDKDYRERADLWPLEKDGELVNWTIVESKEGLAHVKEIAAVKGIGVLWPGAGTLRQVFSVPKMGADGKQEMGPNGRGVTVLDQAAWEGAIQQVLSACQAAKVACGFPASNPDEVALRYTQGFRVFVAGWGDTGFNMVKHGRELAGRKE